VKRRAFSIRTRSGSRSLKLPFRKYCIFFVFYVLLCVAIWASLNLSRIASFKRSWELLLMVSTWLYVLSTTLELKIKRIVKPNVFFTIKRLLQRCLYLYCYLVNPILHYLLIAINNCFPVQSTNFHTWGQCYKTFSVRDFRIFVLS
jgi:hypothetical protein